MSHDDQEFQVVFRAFSMGQDEENYGRVICICTRDYTHPQGLAYAMDWAVQAGHSFTTEAY